MIKNTASQKVGAQMVAAADGSAFTGSVTVSVTGDAGTQATGSVGSGACAHEGNGYHTYAPAQAETNYDLIAFTFTGTGAVPQTVQVYTRATAPDVNVTTWLGTAAATPTVAGVPEVDITHIGGTAVTAAAGIPEVKVASLATGSITAGVIAADAIGASELAADAVAEIADAVWDEAVAGHVSAGTFGATDAAILADTNELQVDDYPTSIAAIKADTAAILIDTATIDTAGEIAAAVWSADATTYQTQGTFGQAIGDPAADTNSIFKAVVTDATGATVGVDGAAILADTNELQTDWVNGGRLDLILDIIAADTTTDIPATLTTIAGYLDTEVAAILADTNELQTDWANGGRLDLILDIIAADTTTDIPALIATLQGFVDTEVAAIKAKTDQLTFTTANQVDAQALSLATGAITAGSIAADAIGASELAADAATEIATAVWASATRTLSALGFTLGASDLAADTIGASELATDAITEIVSAVWTSALTESYNTDGAAPTPAQALFVIMQRLVDFAISGTSIAVKGLDGTTTKYTLTLDDATNPTSSSRAT